MSNPIHQHWLPQFYLREFAVPGFRNRKKAKVWVMNIASGTVEKRKVSETAAIDYLYSHARTDGGRCFRVERELGKLESVMAQLYPCIAEGTPEISESSGIKKVLALFVASFLLRHPLEEPFVRSQHQAIVDRASIAPKDAAGRPILFSRSDSGRLQRIDTSEYAKYNAVDEADMKRLFAAQIMPVSVAISDELIHKQWRVLCFHEPLLFTSDMPVVRLHPSRKRFGIGTPGTEILFPLTPHRVIWMTDREEGLSDGFFSCPSSAAGMLNCYILGGAEQFITSHEEPDRALREVSRYHGHMFGRSSCL